MAVIPTPPKIHGHRGARGRRPENTLAAFEYALRYAADGMELDVCVTADDVVVVHHDLHLNVDSTRDVAGAWVTEEVAIRSLTLQQLQQYEVGKLNPASDYAAKFPEQQSVDDARVLTLAECINWFKQNAGSDTVLNIELKNDPNLTTLTPPSEKYVQMVLDILTESKLPPAQTFLQSFDWQLMRIAKKLRPALKVGFTQDPPYSTADITAAKNDGADVFSAHYQNITADKIAHAHALGLEVCVWTVNDEADIKSIAALGVDVITSDYPDRCRRVIG